jgi:fibronectin-binding autotransporter adhesin
MRQFQSIVQLEDRVRLMKWRPARLPWRSQMGHAKWLTVIAAVGVGLPGWQSSARAQTDSWIGSSSNWSNPANWSLDTVPSNFQSANISDNDAQDRTVTYDYNGPQVTLATLTVVNTGGGTNSLVMGASSSAVYAEDLLVGAPGSGSTLGGVGVLSQSGGVATILDTIYLGQAANDNGTYNLANGELFTGPNSEDNLYVGYSGTGAVNQSGGDIQPGGSNNNNGLTVYLGYNASGTGTYNMTGGLLSFAGGLFVGYNGAGNFIQSAGVVQPASTNGAPIYVGYNAGSTGSYELDSGSILLPQGIYLGYNSGASGSLTLGTGSPTVTATTFLVGYDGTGTFIQNSGTTEVGVLYIGENSYGELSSGEGSAVINGGDVVIYSQGLSVGNGSLTVAGGLVDISPGNGDMATAINVASNTGPGAMLILSGGQFLCADGGMNVGGGQGFSDNGTGTVIQSAGSNTLGTLSLGGGGNLGGPGIGYYFLSGGSLSVIGAESAGYNGGIGTFTQTGGTNSAGTLALGGQAGGVNVGIGTYNLSGAGTLAVSGDELIGGGGTGTFDQTGGANSAGTLAIGGQNSGQPGTYVLSGGTLIVISEEGIGGTGTFTQSGGSNTTSTLYIGGYPNGGGAGSYLLSATGTLTISGSEYLGYQASGSFVQSAGSNNCGTLAIGVNTHGTYLLSGGALAVAGPIDIGSNDSDSFTISGGSATAASLFNTGTFTLSNGSLALSGTITNENQNSAAVSIIGGSITAADLNNLGSLTVSNGLVNVTGTASNESQATISISGGSASFASLNNMGTFAMSNGNLTVSGTFTNQSQSTNMLISGGSITGASVSNFGTLNMSNGLVNITGTITNESQADISVSGGTITAHSVKNSGTLSITNTGSVVLTGLFIQSKTGTLSIQGNGTLDLTDSPMTINYNRGSDPISSIQSYLQTGYNNGAWNGVGIISSTVAGLNSSQSNLVYSIGYADGADGIVAGLSSGVIEVMPTLAGDARLQGNVVFGDFQLLSQYFGTSGGWDEGNFTYGSTIDFADFQLLTQNFGANSAAPTAGEIAALDTFAAQGGESLMANPDGIGFQLISVPEPVCLAPLALGATALLTRRRGKPINLI